MYILGMIILVFFAVIGLSVFIGTLTKANSISNTEGFLLLIPEICEDNAEARIRSAVKMAEASRGCRIVCICGEASPARGICEKLQARYPQVEIVNEYGKI